MLVIGEYGWKVYGSSFYYFCNFKFEIISK